MGEEEDEVEVEEAGEAVVVVVAAEAEAGVEEGDSSWRKGPNELQKYDLHLVRQRRRLVQLCR